MYYHGNVDTDKSVLESRYLRVKAKADSLNCVTLYRGTLEDFINSSVLDSPNVDVVYIDGDHSFEGAYADLMNSTKILSGKCMIIVDDYGVIGHGYGITRAVNAFLADHNDFIVNGLLYNQLVLTRGI